MNWYRTQRTDPHGRQLADRHYSRQSHGAREFSPPGRNLTLRTLAGDAVWVTCWPLPEWVKHRWGDCWTCTIFRNEGPILSSQLVEEAVAASRAHFAAAPYCADPPTGGFLTFVDPGKVRRKRDPGRCFRKAGFEEVGETQSGLVVLRLERGAIGPPVSPLRFQLALDVA